MKQILIIDDEVKLGQMLKQRLELSGAYQVTLAHSGKEGLAQATRNRFDLVITDVVMPGMQGDVVARALKAMDPTLPVVLLSVHHDDSTKITYALRRQVDGVLAKPINHEQLLKTIHDVTASGDGGHDAAVGVTKDV